MEKHIILLHGALGSKAQFEELEKQLSVYTHVHSFDFMGHGGVSIPEHFNMEGLVWQLGHFIQQNIPKDAQLVLFGYSMGGYAALLLASKNLFNIHRVITLGTKLIWDKEIASNEIKMLNPQLIEEKLPDFARDLRQRHAPQDWKVLLAKTAEMMIGLGENEYLNEEALAEIQVPCKLMIGEKDRMVSLVETEMVAGKIKNSTVRILRDTPHPIEKVDLHTLAIELA